MKNNVIDTMIKPQRKRIRPASPAAVKGATTIKCGHCQNVFSAVPRDAVCLKCKRPANKPLFWPLMLLCLICFPAGLLTSVLLRRSQPYAASQALLISVVGAFAWVTLYLLFSRG